MASSLIHSWRSTTGDQPPIKRPLAQAGNTYLEGTPVMIIQAGPNAGYLGPWDGATINNGIAGFSLSYGTNLTTNGTAKTLTFGSVPNESLAVKIPVGAPVWDGKEGIELASPSTVFFGEVGPAQLVAQTDIGKQYGMTKDADGHWFVDRTKVAANIVVCSIVDIDANVNVLAPDTRGIYFVILPAVAQIVA